MNWKQVKLVAVLSVASGVGCNTSVADPAAVQPVKTTNELSWGETVGGLRLRLTAPAGNAYRRRMALPLVLELQNVSKKSVPIAEWGLYASPEVTDVAGKRLMMRRLITVSPWEGRTDSFAPGDVIRWTVGFDRLRFREPPQAGSRVQVRFRFVRRELSEKSGKTAPLLEVFSNSLELLIRDNHSTEIASADDLPEKWTDSMDLVYREDMSIRGYRAMHIDGTGRAHIVRSRGGAPDELLPSGRTETALSREHLDNLAKLLREQKSWELPNVQDYAAMHQTDILLSLASDGSSLYRIIPMSMVKNQPALYALQKEMHRLMAIAVASSGNNKSRGGTRD